MGGGNEINYEYKMNIKYQLVRYQELERCREVSFIYNNGNERFVVLGFVNEISDNIFFVGNERNFRGEVSNRKRYLRKNVEDGTLEVRVE
ncbi:MAG: hypothetical protein ABIF88_02500 [archaeon]